MAADDSLCSDCGQPIAIHFDARGAPRGCPVLVLRSLRGLAERPRVTLRAGLYDGPKGGVIVPDRVPWYGRKDHLLCAFADTADADGVLLIWDVDTDEQFWGGNDLHFLCSRRLPAHERERAQTKTENRLGEKVRVVLSAFAKDRKRTYDSSRQGDM